MKSLSLATFVIVISILCCVILELSLSKIGRSPKNLSLKSVVLDKFQKKKTTITWLIGFTFFHNVFYLFLYDIVYLSWLVIGVFIGIIRFVISRLIRNADKAWKKGPQQITENEKR